MTTNDPRPEHEQVLDVALDRMIDRVSPRDRARTVARADAVRDTVEISDAARAANGLDMTLADAEAALAKYTRYFTIRLERTWQANQQPRTTEWSVCCTLKSDMPFRIFASTNLRSAVTQAMLHMTADAIPTASEVSEQVERFGDDGPCCGGGSQCRCGGGE